MHSNILITLTAVLCTSLLKAQDSLQQIPPRYLEKVTQTAHNSELIISKRSEAALKTFKRLEEKIKRQMMKKDSTRAVEVFKEITTAYKRLATQISTGDLPKTYVASLDTIGTSLQFIQQDRRWLSGQGNVEKNLEDALRKFDELEATIDMAEHIKRFLQERKQFLEKQMGRATKHLKKINKQVFYYSQQLEEYKQLLGNRKKAERKAIELLTTSQMFHDFMKKNSELAAIFRLPGATNDMSDPFSLLGLQTNAQVNELIRQRAGRSSDVINQMGQSMKNAKSYLSSLKDKIGGKAVNEPAMPENFKPNTQKTKTFWKRVEFGAHTQSQEATNFFPVTTDLGLSLGYKLNDKSIIGLGASYKLGLGRDWNHIKFTHEGFGLHSSVDWKIKGNLWLSGGYEQNYRQAFRTIDALRRYSSWQQSGLLGISKIISTRTKLFKKIKIQMLWDFLSYQQVPRTKALLTRIGYTF